MAYAGDIRNTIAALDLGAIAHDILVESTEAMADLNAGQLARGLRSDNSEIAPPYADATVFEKQRKSGLAGITDRVTLYDEGDHYRELYAQVQGEDMEYGSKDEKSAKLQKKYGKAIYGLSDESKETLKDDVTLPKFKQKIESLMGLTY